MKTKTFDEYYSQPSIHAKQVKTHPAPRNLSLNNDQNSICKNYVFPFIDDTSDSQFFIKSYKNKLLNAIDSTVKSINKEKSLPRKLKSSPNPLSQKRTNSLRSLQQRNLERIKQEENNLVEEAFNSFRETIDEQKKTIFKNTKKRQGSSFQSKERSVQERLIRKSIDQNDNSELMLENINKKLEKSVQKYLHSLERKKRFAVKNSNRAHSVIKTPNSEITFKRLEKIISKTKELEKRKKEFAKIEDRKVLMKKKKLEDKLEKIKATNINKEIDQLNKCQDIENRIKAYDDLIESHKKTVEQEQKEKFEKLRLREAGIFRNFIRNVEKQ